MRIKSERQIADLRYVCDHLKNIERKLTTGGEASLSLVAAGLRNKLERDLKLAAEVER
jgi:hypothetical protein